MKEAVFIKRNQDRWQQIERELTGLYPKPDRMGDIFIQLTDDLSFARTQYPGSRVTTYLNGLASKIHLQIYKNKKEDRKRFITFWKYELPAIMFASRMQLFYSFVIFMATATIGAISAFYDDSFTRLILGDSYVNMTIENIRNGNPTAVYEGMNEFVMFFAITLNNIMVSFRVIVYGLLTSLGTGYALMNNGIMVGAFIALFSQYNELAQAFPVIMLHGTIELSSIVIAGAGGIVLGNSILFPGTYSRLDSFKMGAAKAMKIGVGLVPFFVVAGFIESFITRYAFMPVALKVILIGVSAFVIIYYFVIYPYRLVHGRVSTH